MKKLERYELNCMGYYCTDEDVQELESKYAELEAKYAELEQQNKWLKKEKDGMIQYDRDKRAHLYKMADKLGFFEEL